MTYKEAMDFLEQSKKLGSVLGLDTITELMRRLNNPQDKLKIIHIAGTNGKGSTAAFITSVLCAAGYRVGRFVSPAVFTYREIIQISECCHINDESKKDAHLNKYLYDEDGKHMLSDSSKEDIGEHIISTCYIGKEDIRELISIIKPVCGDMVNDGWSHPTCFEIETAMAFLYMERKQVDLFVLETGMGGRLDATNVVSRPVCSVITKVSFDHMKYLGDTLRQIAVEKAGIMKPGSVVITCNQHPDVFSVFLSKAMDLDIPLIKADCGRAGNIRYYLNQTVFSYPDLTVFDNNKADTENFKIRLLGKHQVQNAVLAIETARVLNKLGYNINEKEIRAGLWMAEWPGRFEQVSNKPDIYIDGAHNEDAALKLRDSVEMYFTNRRLIFMIGVLADKDYRSMLRIMAPLADTIITLTPYNARALPSEMLAEEAKKYCGRVLDGRDIRQALEMAYNEAGNNDVILAFGSLSFLGDLIDALNLRKADEQ